MALAPARCLEGKCRLSCQVLVRQSDSNHCCIRKLENCIPKAHQQTLATSNIDFLFYDAKCISNCKNFNLIK